MRILLVEDEENIRELLKLNLELDGYEVLAISNGKKAIDAVDKQHFDLLLLDIMLPEVNGLQIAEHVRLTQFDVPIIFLTAKGDPEERIEGLKKGGDDYITKPFNLEELLLRVKNQLRRKEKESNDGVEKYTFGDYSVNFNTYEVKGPEKSFELTNKEAMLLKLLIDRRGEVVSRQQILQAVWGYDVYPSTRTIDNFILSFRKYFEKDSKNPEFFHSVRGVGYKFVDESN
ncbi:MAG: response regulator [Bacteroidetes bacterium]|jgi:two-component system alkaline phosphatase synthesis response regulator PhoP|nr:response regulator [Bacteroidota bacterium]